MTTSPVTTLRNAILAAIRKATAYATQRPLSAAAPARPDTHLERGDPEPEAAPAPIPETIPEPSNNSNISDISEDVVPDPAQQLASILIPVPPQPKCTYPTEFGYDWMLSHRFVATVGTLVCEDCGERWPRPREER